MASLTDLTLTAPLQSLRRGDISSRELTGAYLERIQRLEPSIHAFLTLTPDQALSQADAADRQLAAWRRDRNSPLPELLGAPLALKDVLCRKGVPCTCGSRILEDFIPPYSTTAVESQAATIPEQMSPYQGRIVGNDCRNTHPELNAATW